MKEAIACLLAPLPDGDFICGRKVTWIGCESLRFTIKVSYFNDALIL